MYNCYIFNLVYNKLSNAINNKKNLHIVQSRIIVNSPTRRGLNYGKTFSAFKISWSVALYTSTQCLELIKENVLDQQSSLGALERQEEFQPICFKPG
jgi:hypothetical protein